MQSRLITPSLDLITCLSRGIISHGSNRFGKSPLDLTVIEHLSEVHQVSARILFIVLVTLWMEEWNLLPQNDDFRENHGIFGLRKLFLHGHGKYGGKSLGLCKRIQSTIEYVFSGSDNCAALHARLFDPENSLNHNAVTWKFYDKDIIGSLDELFLSWPHPGTSLLAIDPPSIDEIIDIYSELLDFDPYITESDCLVFKNRLKVVPLDDASAVDIKRGEILPAGNLVYGFAKGKSRKSGTVYTPDEIVNKIVSRALDPLYDEKSDGAFLKVIDPACGTGKFLIGALNYLVGKKAGSNGSSRIEIERTLISRSLFGVDHDSLAVELAEILLMLRTQRIDNPAPPLWQNLLALDSLCGIDSNTIRRLIRTGGSINDELEENGSQSTFDEIGWRPVWQSLVNSDNMNENTKSLSDLFDLFINYLKEETQDFKQVNNQFQKGIGDFSSRKNSNNHSCHHFHPEVYFPSIFFDSSGEILLRPGFDAVLGNPPYGDILDAQSKELLRKLGYKSGGGGNNDIFRFFVELGLTLLKSGGMLGFILPNTFLKGRKYKNFRRRILELSYPEEILDFDLARVFRREVYTSLLFLRKKPALKIQPVFLTSRDGSLHNLKHERFDPNHDIDDSWLPSGDLYLRLLDDHRFQPLDPFFVRIGDVGINYQRKSVGWTERAKSRIADEIFYEGEQENPDDKLFLKGEDVERFCVIPKAKRWLRHDWQHKIQDGEVVNVNFDWAMKEIKILSRQTGDSVIAAIDTNGYLTGRSLHTSIVRDNMYSPYYILALLNSPIMTSVYRELTREHKRPQAQVKLSFLRRLPVRRIDFSSDEDKRKEFFNSHIDELSSQPADFPVLVEELVESKREAYAHDLIAFMSSRIESMIKANGSNGAKSELNTWQVALNDSVSHIYKL